MLFSMHKKLLCAGLSVALLTSSITSCDASKPVTTNTPETITYSMVAALAPVAISLYLFYSRKPTDAANRVEWQDVKPLICNPINLVRELKNNFSATIEILRLAYLDLVIGHPAQSSTLKADKDGNISPKAGVESRGLLGKAHDQIKPLQLTALALTGFYLLFSKQCKESGEKFGWDKDFVGKILLANFVITAVTAGSAPTVTPTANAAA